MFKNQSLNHPDFPGDYIYANSPAQIVFDSKEAAMTTQLLEVKEHI